MRKTQSLIASVIIIALPVISAAESIPNCVEQSNHKIAISVCRDLLSEGKDHADVYLRLIKALNATQQTEQALSIATEATAKYPNDEDISNLKSVVASNQRESDFVKQKIEKTPSTETVSKTALRIARAKCLRSKDQTALDACNTFISGGGKDQQVNDRLASLLASSATAVALPDATPVREIDLTESADGSNEPLRDVPVNEPIVDATAPLDNNQNEQSEQQARQNRERRELVINIQTALNELGFDSGVADGAAGSKTDAAIDQFYRSTNIASHKPVGDSLLSDLILAQRNLNKAQEIMQQSETALLNDNPELAANLLENARSMASWISVPTTLENRIALAVNSRLAKDNDLKQQRRERELVAKIKQSLNDTNLSATDSALQAALREFPNSAELSILRQQYDNALQAQSDALKKEQESQLRLAALLDTAQQQTNSGDFDKAKQTLEEALAIAPTDTRVATAITSLEYSRQKATLLAAEKSNNQTGIPKQENKPATEPAAILTAQNNARLDELLQRGKTMRSLHKKNRTTLTNYFKNNIPDALVRLFQSQQ